MIPQALHGLAEATHIFKKDVRNLRYEIVIVLALTALYTGANVREAQTWWQKPGLDAPMNVFEIFVLISWILLLVRVVQLEAIPGDRQFWLTRPYSRPSLLAAKLLFAALVINVPLLISDIVTIAANGFAPGEHVAGFIAKQIVFICLVETPVLAVAAMTRKVGHLILTGFALFFLSMTAGSFINGYRQGRGSGNNSLDWFQIALPEAIVVLAAMAIIISQFIRRTTRISRIIGIGGLGCALVVYALEQPHYGSQGVRFTQSSEGRTTSHDTSSYKMGCGSPDCRFLLARNIAERRSGSVNLGLPVELRTDGHVNPWIEYATITITAAGKDPLTLSVRGVGSMRTETQAGSKVFPIIDFELPQFDALKNTPVKIDLSATWILWSNNKPSGVVTVDRPPVSVPHVGTCAWTANEIRCRAAFQSPAVHLAFQWPGALGFGEVTLSNSPLPIDGPIDPIQRIFTTSFGWSNNGVEQTTMEVAVGEPLARIQRSLVLENLRLADYER